MSIFKRKKPAPSGSEKTTTISKKKLTSIRQPSTISVYAIYPCPSASADDFLSSPSATSQTPIYIADSYDSALIAIQRLVYLNHSDHFALWCNSHNLPLNLDVSWNQYQLSTLVDEEGNYADPADRFLVAVVTYKFDTFVGGMRALLGIDPLFFEPSCLIELDHIKKFTGESPSSLGALAKVDPVAGEIEK